MYATLSLLIRSLRVSSRQLRTYLIAFAAVGGMFWALVWSQQTKDFYGAPGLRFLDWIATINFFFISFAAASYFSSAITDRGMVMTDSQLRVQGAENVYALGDIVATPDGAFNPAAGIMKAGKQAEVVAANVASVLKGQRAKGVEVVPHNPSILVGEN